MMKLVKFGAFAIALCIGLASPAQAKAEGSIEYRIEAGDTLYDLAQDYFTSESAIAQVQKLNRISNARRLQIGQVIAVPRELLKSKRTNLEVLSFSGPAVIRRGKSSLPAERKMAVLENDIVLTPARSFVSIGDGQSRISLPSNSRILIKSARRYLIDNSLDVDVRVLTGRGEVTAPKLKKGERFRVGTPLAVTAVRGTKFRVGYDGDNDLALTEVVEGLVEVSDGVTTSAPPAASGVASTPAGVGNVEPLLTAPIVKEPGIQTGEMVEIAIDPVDGATAYRAQIATDQTFTDIISETIASTDTLVFEQVPDGRLAVRVRGVAENGLEGLSGNVPFRRKRVGAVAGVEPSPFEDSFKFAWRPEGEGQSFAAFQMWPKGSPDDLIVDEVGLGVEGIYVTDLAPGAYMWRLATFQIDEGDVIKVWTEPQELTFSE